MSVPPDDSGPAGGLGDYELGELLAETPRVLLYHARQISIDRPVVVELLRPEILVDAAAVGEFLADVRLRGAIDDPRLGSVYEAVHGEGAVYYARESLPGTSLAALASRGEKLGTRRTLELLLQAGEILAAFEAKGLAAAPLSAHHLMIPERGPLRMVNLAIAGERTSNMSWQERETLADALRRVLRTDRPGATRTGKLLDYVAARGEGSVTWQQILKSGRKLLESLETSPTTRIIEPANPPKRGVAWILISLLALVLLLALGGWYLVQALGSNAGKVTAKAPVEVPAGSYPGPGGRKVTTGQLWFGAGEVTIGEYAKFLRALELIGPENRTAFDHPAQPAHKEDHEPADWEAMLAAARARGSWLGRPVTEEHPVVNVDWWDAYAYANWKEGRLPTLAEWFAAWQGEDPEADGWGPAMGSGSDVAAGIHGLAGNVCEWVRDSETNPSFPMNPKAPVICGGSFRSAKPLRRWVESRSYRAPDLGFRVVFENAPEAP